MVTGASTADLAVILIDARKGVLVQTRRHSYLCHLIGIRNIVLAVNKMDLVDYSQEVFDAHRRRLSPKFAEEHRHHRLRRHADLGLQGRQHHHALGTTRRGIRRRSISGARWSITLKRSKSISTLDQAKPFRMPVQWVNRPNLDFRGFSGQIATGSVAPGDAIRVLPSGKTSTVSGSSLSTANWTRPSPASR
jgi:bifunctional enzyme CysN/CysC